VIVTVMMKILKNLPNQLPKTKNKKKAEAKKSEPTKDSKKDDDDPIREGDESDDTDDSDDEEAAENDKKRKADEIDAKSPPAKKVKTENGGVPTGATATATSTGDSKKVFVANLSFQIDDDTIREVFKDIGEIVNIDWFSNKEGNFRGSGTLEFESHEIAKKAISLKETEVLGRKMFVDLFKERPEGGRGDRGDRRGRGDRGRGRGARGGGGGNRETSEKPENCDTVYLGNLSYDINDDAIKEVFGGCGNILAIRWVEKDGTFRGCGFLQFEDTAATDKAVELAGTEIMGRPVRVDYAASKSRKQF